MHAAILFFRDGAAMRTIAETSPASKRQKSLPSGERISMPGARNRADSASRAVEEESFNLGFIITGYPFDKLRMTFPSPW